MNLPEVKLEVWLPPAIILWEGFTWPRVWKMTLTEDSEMQIFGDISPCRTAPAPPLPWLVAEHYCEKKLAIIDEEQTKIYNGKIHKNEPIPSNTIKLERIIPSNTIKPGVVEVFRVAYNVQLKNVDAH